MVNEYGYSFPDRRTCPPCPNLKFKDMEDHAAHLATHNPTPAQWAEAHKRVTAGNERAKKAARNSATD